MLSVFKVTKLFPVFLLMLFMLLLTSCKTMTPLTKAASDGDAVLIRNLIRQGNPVNEPSKDKYYVSGSVKML